MGERTEQASFMLGPAVEGAGRRVPERLANTGTTESHSTALTVGAFATLINDTDVPVCYTLRAASGAVANTDLVLGPYGRLDWQVERLTCVANVEAADGSSAYATHVFQSSP